MKYFFIFSACICFSAMITFWSDPVSAQEDNGSIKPLICTVGSYFECEPGKGCVSMTAEGLNAPRFMKILLDDKKIIPMGRAPEDTHASKIRTMVLIDGAIIIQGFEDGDPGKRDGVGWSVSIDQKTGRMALTASGQDTGFVGLGACTTY